ncbi:MAG: hypothetical protein COB67_02925 [SAR324 cluster bacterium]|uniref:Uncharacterized protein n=1 Tax=SAR324 cluster bacterium TaxID=2024889 RepID=A0A2A4T997_9DELT|nr:MAG: hypothetical protein COB67_02925 [SAR324 cluster bacterium]
MLPRQSTKAELRVKEGQGFKKGSDRSCAKCFNVFLNQVTGTFRCELGHFDVDAQDCCDQWVTSKEWVASKE